MNVRRALPKIHFEQTLYRKVNTCVFATKRQRKFNISPYAENFNQLTYWDKILNRESYIFEKYFTTKNSGMTSGCPEITVNRQPPHASGLRKRFPVLTEITLFP